MSAIIGSLIPKIEGFQPIPNSVMIPFMEAQSAALAFAFGLNYEYGKRTVRSMSNEKFNSLTSEDISRLSTEHTEIILKDFINAVPKVMPAQHEIFRQYVTIEKAKVVQNFELAKWMVGFIKQFVDDETAHLMGGHIHDTKFNEEQQTYFDPNDPTKDFVPPPKLPPKTTVPKDIPKPPNAPLTQKQFAQNNINNTRRKIENALQSLRTTPKTIKQKRPQGFATAPPPKTNPAYTAVLARIRELNNKMTSQIRNFVKNFGEQPKIT